jgi:hypothetical protein
MSRDSRWNVTFDSEGIHVNGHIFSVEEACKIIEAIAAQASCMTRETEKAPLSETRITDDV